jgi:tRNA-2-methylthio-N6-dimethylallyladenosine synthase
MGRGYTRKEYLLKVAALRRARPGICFSSDFIVGFPGETEEDFLETLDVMEEVRYDASFSFRFSSRPGTRAAELEDPVDSAIAGERLRRLQSLQDRLSMEGLSGMIGRVVEVLEEGESARGGGRLCGRTPCHKTVNFDPAGSAGPFRDVLVTSAGTHSLVGEERG